MEQDKTKYTEETPQETGNVVDHLREGMVMLDPAGRPIRVGLAAMAVPGWQGTPGESDDQTTFFRHCDVLDLSGNIIPSEFWPVNRVLRGEKFSDYRVEIRDRHGKTGWVASYSGIPVQDTAGRQILSILTVRDISPGTGGVAQRRRENDFLHAVLNTLYIFVGVLTPEGVVLEINTSALEFVGLAKEEVLSRSFCDMPFWQNSPQTDGWQEDDIRKAGTGEEVRKEIVLKLPGDRSATMDFVLAPLMDEQGRVQSIIASGVDVTGQKKFEQHLKNYQRELEAMVLEKTRALTASNEQLTKEIVERRQTEQELLKYQHELRHLSAHIQKVGEEEQRKLSREIHDELGQLLTAIKMDLYLIRHRYQLEEELVGRLLSIEDMVGNTIKSSQEICRHLRPTVLDDLGLAAAMESHLADFVRRYGLNCRFDIDIEDHKLEQAKVNTIFRIFQESLTNIARHAEASAMDGFIRVENDTVIMEIRDNGAGIPEEALNSPRSYGLMGMRERLLVLSGGLDISGKKNEGTTVRMTLPV